MIRRLLSRAARAGLARASLARAAVAFLALAALAGPLSTPATQRILGPILGVAPAAASVDGARDFLKSLSADAVAAMGEEAPSRDALQKIIERGLDVDAVGRFALGPFLRQSNPKKVEEYLALFRSYVLISYPGLLAKLKLRQFEILTVKSQDEHVTYITSRIGYGESDTVEVGWYVREVAPDQYKIQDVQVSGNSLRVFQRAKFEKILRDRWIDGLIKTMEHWVESGREDPIL